jgi:hypothetical protein
LKAATYDEFRQRYGEFIEKYGGLYNPGFNWYNIFDDKETGWLKLLGIIKQTHYEENTINVIKNLKAKKKLMDSVLNHKNKDLLLKNENILKWFAYDQFFKKNNNPKDAKKLLCPK